MSWRRKWLTAAQASILVVVVLAVDVAVSGFLVFANARTDDLRQADAIIVLGGEHDGREDYGISLAREGWAPTVVISNPYDDWDPVMKRVCRPAADVEVICARPDPLTTRGEAVLMQRLALERNWSTIIVVSWRYHLPRARLVFDQCFSDRPGSTVMVAVPRRYRYSLFRWEFVFAYQWAGLAKALAQGECS
jgi:uncharacterized SAM-binding protein YcdF (DUF218 family)